MSALAVDTGAPPERRRLALALGWTGAAAALAAAAIWVWAIPPSLSSDDALFLLHSLTRFSILDFSPQFPGYPGAVAMGRLALVFTHDPLAALALTSALIALAIPPAAAWVVWRVTMSSGAALAAFTVALLCPLMPDLAVSLLSDGAAILFLLIFLAFIPRDGEPARLRLLLAGVALGWAFACRPSDALLFAGAFLAVAITRPRFAVTMVAGAAAVLVPVAAVVYALEGPLYWEEGLRFLSGHATIWGNTAFAATPHESWLAAVAAIPFASPIAILLALGVIVALAARARSVALTAAIAAFVIHAVWIVTFQNPDHLRHLAPLALLGVLVFVVAAARLNPSQRRAAVALLLAVECAALAAFNPLAAPGRPSPLAAAETWLAARQPVAIATNEGVFTLRQALPDARVYDAHYAADAALGLATASSPALRLTSTRVPGAVPAAVFPARFPGEHTLFLYPASFPK